MTGGIGPGRVGRPRGFDPQEALDRAMDLFWRKGYAQVSVPDLSVVTGLSTSSIYNSFGSKHELFVAALDRYLLVAHHQMLEPMWYGSGGTGDVRAFLDRLDAVVRSADTPRGCLMIKSMAEFGARDPDVVIRTGRYRRDLRAALTAALTRAAGLGQLPGGSVGTRASALQGIVVAINLLVSADAAEEEITALFDAARSLLRVEPSETG